MRGTPGYGVLSMRRSLSAASPGSIVAGTDWKVIIWVSPVCRVVTRVPASGMNFQMIRSRYGGPAWSLHGARRVYAALRVSVTWSPATYSEIVKGPLVTGRWPTAVPCPGVDFGDSMPSHPLARYVRNGAKGAEKVIRTV